MVFKDFCFLVFWMKVALAWEGLNDHCSQILIISEEVAYSHILFRVVWEVLLSFLFINISRNMNQNKQDRSTSSGSHENYLTCFSKNYFKKIHYKMNNMAKHINIICQFCPVCAIMKL